MLEEHEGIEYLYVFHDLIFHKEGTDTKHAISSTYYFQIEEQFYKQQEMLQDDLEAIGIFEKYTGIINIYVYRFDDNKLKTKYQNELYSKRED